MYMGSVRLELNNRCVTEVLLRAAFANGIPASGNAV